VACTLLALRTAVADDMATDELRETCSSDLGPFATPAGTRAAPAGAHLPPASTDRGAELDSLGRKANSDGNSRFALDYFVAAHSPTPTEPRYLLSAANMNGKLGNDATAVELYSRLLGPDFFPLEDRLKSMATALNNECLARMAAAGGAPAHSVAPHASPRGVADGRQLAETKKREYKESNAPELLTCLGRGSFGTVYSARNVRQGPLPLGHPRCATCPPRKGTGPAILSPEPLWLRARRQY